MPDWIGAGEGAISGAEAGAAFGPEGAVIGGAVGALSGILSPSADSQRRDRFNEAMAQLAATYTQEKLDLSTIIGKETDRRIARNRSSASRRALSMGRSGSDAEAMILPGQEKESEIGANQLDSGMFGLEQQYNQQAGALTTAYAQRPLPPTALDLFMKAAPAVAKGIMGIPGVNDNPTSKSGAPGSLGSPSAIDFGSSGVQGINSLANDRGSFSGFSLDELGNLDASNSDASSEYSMTL